MAIRNVLIAICSLALLAAPSHGAEKQKDKSDTSRETAYATYVEKAGRVTVVMSSYLMGLGPDEKYLPMRIAVGVKGKGPELAVGIDAFQLIDAKGEMYSTATTEEIAEQKSLIRQTDDMVGENELNTGNEFTDYRRIDSEMYTPEGVGDRYAHVDRDDYFTDVIWFPRPANGLDGVLTLRMDVEGMEQPVDVRFRVPQVGKGIMEHCEISNSKVSDFRCQVSGMKKTKTET